MTGAYPEGTIGSLGDTDAERCTALAVINIDLRSEIERLRAERDRYRQAIERHKDQQDRYWETTTHWDRELYDALPRESS